MISAFLLNSNFRQNWILSRFCLPVMNCEACAWSWLGCPIGAMGSMLGYHEFPWLVVGILLVIGVVAGRIFCGWICPMGLLQDILHSIPSPKFRIPRPMRFVKYAVFVVSVPVVAWFLGRESGLFFCDFCPTATLQVVIPSMIADGDFVVTGMRAGRFAILAFVVLLAVVNHRSFCKVFCPVGALIAITNRLSLFRIRVDSGKCVQCRKCDRSCPMDVEVMESRTVPRDVQKDAECIECLRCDAVCPVDAISSKLSVRGQRTVSAAE